MPTAPSGNDGWKADLMHWNPHSSEGVVSSSVAMKGSTGDRRAPEANPDRLGGEPADFTLRGFMVGTEPDTFPLRASPFCRDALAASRASDANVC